MRSILTGLIVLLTITLTAQNSSLTATDIIKKADEKSRGTSSQSTMQMTVVRPNWSRAITLQGWQKGHDLSMILITAPAKDKGQVFLKIKTDMWNWVPSIEKMVKIPPSMMMQSWMGSDFTNDDLVRESSIVRDYTHVLLGQETIRGQLCYKIELTPLPEAPVTWGKIITWITVDGFNMWQAEYYDEDMMLINVMSCSKIKRFGDREIPSVMEIVPADKQNQKTVLETIDMVFNQPIDDTFFSQQNMKKVSGKTR
jgi:outer membrane lipoprotein-sorting protein